MNRPLTLLLLAATATVTFAQRTPEPPVPVVNAVPEPRPAAAPRNEAVAAPGVLPATTLPAAGQRLYSPGMTILPPEQAAQIVEEFRAAYERLDAPRMVIYVNRELVEDRDGLRLTGR